jgi:AcrR family transcriptional regulator
MANGRAGKRGEGRGADRRRDRRDQAARQIERAMLELSGEHGYANVTIAAVMARSGSNRQQFYTAFESKAACFEAAYGATADALVEQLLGGCPASSSWALATEPDLARGVFAEGGALGGKVASGRREALARLTEAIDRGRREIPDGRPVPPDSAAIFIAGAIEAGVVRSFADPGAGEIRDELADLLYLAVDLYLGPEAARNEVRAFRAG